MKKTTMKEDLVKTLKEHNLSLRQIEAATYVKTEPFDLSKPIGKSITLYPGHTDSDFDKWLLQLEYIDYDSKHETDFLSTIWLKNNIWLDRTRCKDWYFSWWVVHKRPPLPKKNIKIER